VSDGQRKNYRDKWSLLKSHFEDLTVADVTTKFLLTLRDRRARVRTKRETPVKPTTIKKDFDFIRLALRFAKSEKHLDTLPEFPRFRGPPWTCSPSPRPFLTADEYRTLCDLARSRAPTNPTSTREPVVSAKNSMRSSCSAFLPLSEWTKRIRCDGATAKSSR